LKGGFGMSDTISINIRMDKELKKQAEEIFNDFGMSMTTAFNIFVKQAIREQAIPFKIQREDRDALYFNPYNIKILKESMNQLENGQVIIKTMNELEEMAND